MNPQQYPPQPGQQPQAYTPQQPMPYPQGPAAMPMQPQQPMPGYGQQAPQMQPMPGQQMPPQQYPQPQLQQPPMQPMRPPQINPMLGYNPYPYPNEYDTPQRKGPNKLVIAIIVLLGLSTIGIGLAALSTGGSEGENTGTNTTDDTTTETTTDQSVKDVVARSDGTLDLRSKVTLSTSLKAQTVKANMKEQVNLSSGFSFMVNKLETYTSPNATTKPADGKKFIVVTTVVGNRNETATISVSYLDFRLRDESNQVIAGHIATNEILSNPLSSPTEIKPGQQITGKVVFEVDATGNSWVFKHSETYQKTTDNTTFAVDGEVVIKPTATTTTQQQTTTTTQ